MTFTLNSASLLLAGILTASLAAAQAPAVDAGKAKSLFEGHECAGCHQVETKVVGPALKQVADKYRGDKAAASRLLDKVKKGGVGVWGEIPMPPNAGITDDELKVVIAWILSM
jgi:cytochrome c